MTTAKWIEHRITRDVMRRRELEPTAGTPAPVERLIMVAAVTAGLLVLGPYLQELLWVVLIGAAVFSLGTSTSPH